MIREILFIVILSFLNYFASAQSLTKPTRQDTLKGSITPERAWWNVLRYDLTIEPDYSKKKITGKNIIEYESVDPQYSGLMQIDLQEPLHIDSIFFKKLKLSFSREGSAWFVTMPRSTSQTNKITVFYSGMPKESLNPPYDGGIVWSTDSLNRPWISVACQLVGGSIWYPCKDHYSDEPDNGATLNLIVNDSLVAVGNGRLINKTSEGGKTSYIWSVVNPINNYGLAFYIGKYINIKRTYEGEKGPLDMSYWVLDYNREKAINHMIPEVNITMKAFEKWFGPYPFYEDSFKMVDAPYIGMEHQSAIAYGNNYQKGRFKFKNLSALDFETDRLIVHEMAHEWLGNNITMSDIADRWVQEGFAAYGEELVMEELHGRETGREFFITRRGNWIKNEHPLISPYGIFKDAGPDMYFKGWAIIHMIREIVDNDEEFRALLRKMNSDFFHQTVTSSEIETLITESSGRDFSKIFDQYLRNASLPVLEYSIRENILKFRFSAEVEGFEMPVKIKAGEDFWINGTTEWQEVTMPGPNLINDLIIDPNFLLETRQVK